MDNKETTPTRGGNLSDDAIRNAQAALSHQFGKLWSDEEARGFFRRIRRRITDDELIAALDEHLLDPTDGKRPPKPAHIMGHVERTRQVARRIDQADHRCQELEAMAHGDKPAQRTRCAKCRDTGTWAYWANPEDLREGGRMIRYTEDELQYLKEGKEARPLYRYMAPCFECDTGRAKHAQVSHALDQWHKLTHHREVA